MKKKYLIPETTVVEVGLHLMQQTYSGGDSKNGVKVDGTADDSDDPNRSRRRRNAWDEEEEDW
jgi:hypothetical protein